MLIDVSSIVVDVVCDHLVYCACHAYTHLLLGHAEGIVRYGTQACDGQLLYACKASTQSVTPCLVLKLHRLEYCPPMIPVNAFAILTLCWCSPCAGLLMSWQRLPTSLWAKSQRAYLTYQGMNHTCGQRQTLATSRSTCQSTRCIILSLSHLHLVWACGSRRAQMP